MQSARFFLGLALTGLLPILAGQPPGESVRLPQPPASVPPPLQQYDFGAQLRTLENPSSVPLDVKAQPTTPGGPIPKDYHPKSDIALPATAIEAVRVSESWREEKNAPSPGPDGRVMYSYGAGLP